MGLVFLAAGAGKLLLPILIPHLRPGSPTFPEALAALGVPLPVLTAYLVCALEVGAAWPSLRGERWGRRRSSLRAT